VLDGRRAYAVNGLHDELLTVDLSADYLTGRVLRTQDSRFDFPTKIALHRGSLLVANSQLGSLLSGQPLTTPLSVLRVALPGPGVSQVSVTTGLAGPESVWWSADTGHWYVTNYGGDGFVPGAGKDGNGFVSRLRADGSVETLRFAEGLDNPNGLRGWRGRILIADVDRIVVIDGSTGALIRELSVPGARFLNDVAVDERTGDAYVSDTFTNTIWRIAARSGKGRPALGAGELELFASGPELEAPNGLLVDGRSLLVGGAGPDLDPATFATSLPGRLQRIDLVTRELSPYGDGRRIGTIDGIEKDGSQLIVSDIGTGRLLRVGPSSATTLASFGAGQAADIGFDPRRGVVAVPALFGTTVTFLAPDVAERRRAGSSASWVPGA
jgi:hypothetical protein